MKFYSETLKKLFDSEEELRKEEARMEALAKEEQEKKNKLSSEKKAAAAKVQLALEAYDEAAEEYEKKKKEIRKILDESELKASKIIEEANDKVQGIIDEAEKSLKDARYRKMETIAEFNKLYGPYKTVLTQEDAEKEYNRVVNDIDDWIKKLYRMF